MRRAPPPAAIIAWSTDEGGARDGFGFLTARLDAPGRPFVIDPAGTPHWQQAVYYLYDATRGELRRVTAEPSVLASPTSGDTGRVLAGQVRQFRVTRQGDLLTIALTVAVSPGNSSAGATLETAVRPRN